MKKEIKTEIEIDAPASKVWAILSDFPNFPNWNPFVTSVEGVAREGETLKIVVKVPDAKVLKFTPLVLRAEPDRELRWVGELPLGAFRGEHFYQIEPISESSVRFVHGEHFSGWMVGIIWKMMGSKIEAGYRLMNEAMKAEAEKQ